MNYIQTNFLNERSLKFRRIKEITWAIPEIGNTAPINGKGRRLPLKWKVRIEAAVQ